MAKFNLDNYETVEDRLKVFWKDNPNARINTEIAHITEDGTCVTIRAEVFKQEEDARPVATGIAQETKGQGGFANADAWMENCETSAIGRALANWKYQGSTKPRPSKEEMSKVAKQPTTKKEVVQETTKPPSNNPTNTTGDVGKQLNQLLEAMIPDEALEDMFNAMGIDNKIEQTTDKDIVEEVFGEVTVSKVRTCPECNNSDWIEDNREKKQSNPDKFGGIPSWSCSTYQGNNGCGWVAWGDTDCPKEWL